MTLPDAPPGGLELLADLERQGHVTELGLRLDDVDLTVDQYLVLAVMFGRLHRTSAWLIGDLLNDVEVRNAEIFSQVASAFGLAEQSVQNYASVARKITLSRRRAGVGISKHQEVAPLKPAEQKEWLARTVREDWSRERLRDELDSAGLRKKPQKALMQAPAPANLAELARSVARTARETGDQYLVPSTAMRPLLAYYGEE